MPLHRCRFGVPLVLPAAVGAPPETGDADQAIEISRTRSIASATATLVVRCGTAVSAQQSQITQLIGW